MSGGGGAVLMNRTGRESAGRMGSRTVKLEPRPLAEQSQQQPQAAPETLQK